MRNPPRGLAGHGGARSCARVDGGGSAGGGRRRARVQAVKVRYGYGNWRKGIRGALGCLLKPWGRPELYRRRDHGEDGGAAETERGVREVLGSYGALDFTGRRAMPLRSKTWGQIGPIRTGGG